MLPDGRRGQFLALSLLVVATLAMVLGVVPPALDWNAQRHERLQRQQGLVTKMSALIARLPELRLEALAAPAGDGPRASLMKQATDPLASAALQQAVSELAVAAGPRISSAETLPAETVGNLRSVVVRVTLNARWDQFIALLLAISQAEPPIITSDLQVRGTTAYATRAAVPPVSRESVVPENLVDVSFTVTAYRPKQDGGK